MPLNPISNSWPDFEKIILKMISTEKVESVLEIGAGANPYLTEEQIKKHNLKYSVVDIDQGELNKRQGTHYKKICLDITEESIGDQYNLIFSHMLLEHIPHPHAFHKAIGDHLDQGGQAIHFFATKYSLASIANLLLPSFIKDFIIYKIQKRDPIKEKKFKAYYRKCLGPTNSMKSYFNNLGYEILEYRGYYGHGYLSRYKSLYFFEKMYNRLVKWINSPWFCSNAIVVLKKS